MSLAVKRGAESTGSIVRVLSGVNRRPRATRPRVAGDRPQLRINSSVRACGVPPQAQRTATALPLRCQAPSKNVGGSPSKNVGRLHVSRRVVWA